MTTPKTFVTLQSLVKKNMLGSWTPSGISPQTVKAVNSVIPLLSPQNSYVVSFGSIHSPETSSLTPSSDQGQQFKLLETKGGSVWVPNSVTSMPKSASSDSAKPLSSETTSKGLTLKALDEVIKDIYQAGIVKTINTPTLFSPKPDKPWLVSVLNNEYKAVELGTPPEDLNIQVVEVYAKTSEQAVDAYKAWKEEEVPDITVNAKLLTWGCPACSKGGSFEQMVEMDWIVCHHCETYFAYPWLLKWDGHPAPQMKGTKPSVIFDDISVDENWDPIVDSSLGEKLLRLKEKVIQFREAVVNPDRVTTDEQVEQLLHELFEVSYTLPVGNELDDEPDDIDLAPDEYDSVEEYAKALCEAMKEGLITYTQADDLLKAFGGPDPFEQIVADFNDT